MMVMVGAIFVVYYVVPEGLRNSATRLAEQQVTTRIPEKLDELIDEVRSLRVENGECCFERLDMVTGDEVQTLCRSAFLIVVPPNYDNIPSPYASDRVFGCLAAAEISA